MHLRPATCRFRAAACVSAALSSPSPRRLAADPSLSAMSSLSKPLSSSAGGGDGPYSLADLPKAWRFTQSLPADPQFPTPASSHKTERDNIRPRIVRGALFTWVRPEEQEDPELLAVSPAALRDIGIKASETETDDFRQTAAGNRLWGWDPKTDSEDSSPNRNYPWAQCYGGFQFGQWAGQLGDGRAISLFEVPGAPGAVGPSYEIQLKGAGITPYSRFADGRAVLRSSIREFVVSEALHALGIPSTRALALTLLPNVQVHRESLEPAAIVVRFAESWLRLGTFDLLRARGDQALTRQLAEYASESVLGGWEALPGRLEDRKTEAMEDSSSSAPSPPEITSVLSPARGVPRDVTEGPDASAENRFARFYREVVRRNAATVARWQVYGFMNGVLNTDNTSLVGLSMDFGPFAFLDHFDPSYTPNHDDHHLRYSYRNQASIVWWNLVRFGESLGELLAAGDRVDDPHFITEGILGLAKVDAGEEGKSALDETSEGDSAAADGKPPSSSKDETGPSKEVEKAAEALADRAQTVILRAGEEYKALFLAEYKRLMHARLGLRPPSTADLANTTEVDPLITGLLDVLEQLELDFHLFFRRLSSVRLADLATDDSRRAYASKFFYREGVTGITANEEDSRRRVADWLEQWRERILKEQQEARAKDSAPDSAPDPETARIRAMKAVNPNFVPRGWILDEVIRRVEKDNERDVLRRVMHLALHPFADSWDGQAYDGQVYKGDSDEEIRWTQDVPKKDRAMQCSCSS